MGGVRRRQDLDTREAASSLVNLRGVAILATGLAGAALVGWVDHLAGIEVALSFFYLIPVLATCWFIGRSPGLIVAVAAASVEPLIQAATPSGLEDWVLVWNFLVRGGTLVSAVFLTAALRDALAKERSLARVDALTGVANSRWFLEQAEIQRERAAQTGAPLTLVYMDLDHFKSVNDDYGHAAGDELLREVGSALNAHTRTTDLVGRLGGDEFAIVLPDISPERSLEVVARIVASLSDYASQLSLPVTVSVGVVTTLSATETLEELVWIADNLMYSAKRGGRAAIRQKVLGGSPAEAPSMLEGAGAS